MPYNRGTINDAYILKRENHETYCSISYNIGMLQENFNRCISSKGHGGVIPGKLNIDSPESNKWKFSDKIFLSQGIFRGGVNSHRDLVSCPLTLPV